MSTRLARWVVDHWPRCVGAWVAVLLLALSSAWWHGGQRDNDLVEPLAAGEPFVRAQALARERFPQLYSTADAVLVFHRAAGLTAADRAYIRRVDGQIALVAREQTQRGDVVRWVTKSPVSDPFLSSRLISPRQDTLLIKVGFNAPYMSDTSYGFVRQLRAMLDEGLPDGLVTEITGTAGLGFDRAMSRREADRLTMVCAIVAVLLVLLLVYRAPLAAGVPLLTIGVSAVIAIQIVRLFQSYGFAISGMQITFLVVLVFGSGTDFALFWMSRYAEALASRVPAGEVPAGVMADWSVRLAAAREASTSTMPGIVSSALTTILGLMCLVFSEFQPMQVSGPVIAMSLTISLLTALSLMPALALLFGGWLFWPRASLHERPSGHWERVGRWVTLRPGAVLSVCVPTMVLLSVWPLMMPVRYDVTGFIKTDTSFMRGQAIAEQSFGASALFSWSLLIESSDWSAVLEHVSNDRPAALSLGAGEMPVTASTSTTLPATASSPVVERGAGTVSAWSWLVSAGQRLAGAGSGLGGDGQRVDANGVGDGESGDRAGAGVGIARVQWVRLSEMLTTLIDPQGRYDVWSYGLPLGRSVPAAVSLAGESALRNYLSADGRVLRLEVLGVEAPFSPEAIDDLNGAIARVTTRLRALSPSARLDVVALGPTAYMANVRDVSRRDNVRVQVLVVGAISLVVWALIGDLVITAVLVTVTLGAYMATLTLTYAVFVLLLGHAGIDWKIHLFSFVILMAVGQDYNLFLISRLLEERRTMPLADAMRTAVTSTGRIISSCGLITAVSLGSLMTGGELFLQQLGFALAAGTLLDTFVIRPLFVPAALMLLGRPGAPIATGETAA